MKISWKIIILMAILSVLLVGCSPNNEENTDLKTQLEEKEERITSMEKELEALRDNKDQGTRDNLLYTTVNVLELLKKKDMAELSNFIHPTKGIRISPYGYVDTENHMEFSAEEVSSLLNNTEVYTWGSYDGTGDPIELNFNDYYNKFIFDNDFTNPQIIGNNLSIGQGNSLNNIGEVYPEAHFVELHFKGFDPQYQGMDWSSLKLVFERVEGNWYLVGIVHDQWTI